MYENATELKLKLRKHMEREEYGEVLNTAAELVELDDKDPTMMYDVAYSYFMMGEYERSATWVDHTLQFAPDHVDARILLARLCILEDKIESGLAIFDFILQHYATNLTEEQTEEVTEILDYYGRSYTDTIKQKFPYVAVFLELPDAKLPEVAPTEPSVATPTQAPAAVPSGDSADTTALEEMRQIMAPTARPVREKVRLLNMFAGGYFANGELKTAASFLNTALELDPGDVSTLRNLAVLAHAMGRRDDAFAYAAKLPETDFVLLSELNR